MNSSPISVTRPFELALERVKQVLFRPFDLGRWFVIGFGAWLANLGRGGTGFNFGGHNSYHEANAQNLRQVTERARDYVVANLHWILPLLIGILALGVALGVLLAWLRARGEFMFLHCVRHNRAEIAIPWTTFGSQANSLFGFNLAVGLLVLLATLALLVPAGRTLYTCCLDETWTSGAIALLIACGAGFVGLQMVAGVLHWLTTSFVVPIMALRQTRCLAAWREFGSLFAPHLGPLLLFFLFQIVVWIACAAVIIVAVLVTCCLAGCLMAIPYLGTVLLLPVLVFQRAFTLHYLAQYGPAYDVFAPVAEDRK